MDSRSQVLNSRFHLSGFQIPKGLFLAFWIPWLVFQIPKSRIPYSTSKYFQDFGFHQQTFPNSRIRIILHRAIYCFEIVWVLGTHNCLLFQKTLATFYLIENPGISRTYGFSYAYSSVFNYLMWTGLHLFWFVHSLNYQVIRNKPFYIYYEPQVLFKHVNLTRFQKSVPDQLKAVIESAFESQQLMYEPLKSFPDDFTVEQK